ncbi:ERAD-associated protein, partial [Coemansia sp. RSA 25]
HWLAGPPLGRHMPGYRARLADDRGGAYGVRTGPHALHRATTRAAFAELLAVHRFNARAGNARAALTLADVLYHGHRFHARDLPGARAVLAGLAATLFADKDADSDVAAQAAGMLGVMCWRGEGGPRDTAAALRWLRAGAALGHGASLNALGAMHRDGVEVPADAARAQALFKQAAAAHHAGGQVNYALAVRAAQPGVARALLRAAAESGHVLAHYHVGLEHAAARGEAECRMAVASFRFVAERADWLHSPIAAAEAAAARGDAEAAAVRYMQAAEMGYDVGQANAAVLLDMLCEDGDRGRSLFPSPNTTTRSPTQSSCSRAALVYWTRAANQNVADARAKQGDAYYYGRGVARSYERAAAAYALAARADANGLAMWNLGWMHEHGVGVPQDFHLAKRWYDQSLAANPAGRLAAHASLARLGLRYLWAWARGRDVGEGPLFFAPRPVTLEEEETHQQQQQQRKRANNNNDDPSGDDSDETPPGADGSLSESAFFVALLLAAAWMFLPLR